MLFILALICGFLLGVSLESLFDLPLTRLHFFWIFAVAFLLRNKPIFFIAIFSLGVLRTQFYETHLLSSLKPGFQTLEGTIADELDRRSDYQNVFLLTEGGLVLAKVSLYQTLQFGDELVLQGRLDLRSEMPAEDASYRNYLARQGVVALMPEASVLSHVQGEPNFRRSLYAFKTQLEARLQHLFPEPEASFAAGLLLGSRKGMPAELTTAFRTVGLLHIVAISGANISLIIATVFVLLSFLTLRMRIGLSCFVLAIFVVLVGASSTVIRAAVMGLLTLFGLYFGRRSTALFGLLWSVVLLTFWNPYLLLFDVGFQLSVLSTFGLLAVVPVLEKQLDFFKKMPSWTASFREAFLLTLAAQITTLPLMLYFFGQISWVTPFVNVLAAPLIPLAMLGAFFALLFSWFLAPGWVFLFSIEQIALIGAELPFASFSLTLSLKGLFFVYFLELLFLFRFYKPILDRAFFHDRVPISYKESILEFGMHEKPK